MQQKHLIGTHIRASEKLITDIHEIIYDNDNVTAIPRYILINPNGEIVDKNLPRPSDIEELKKALDKLMK